MNNIVVCIPNYNGGEYLKTMEILPDIDYVVIDNASTDDSVSICRERGIGVVANTDFVDRVYNWGRCFAYFKNSNYDWMKFLCIGDTLEKDCVLKFNDSVARHKDSAAVVYNYNVNLGNKQYITNISNIEHEEDFNLICKRMLSNGNIFGGFMGILFSKKGIPNVLRTHNFRWVADEYFMYQISKNGKVAFCPGVIGTFNMHMRKSHQELENDVLSMGEELEMLRIIREEFPDIYKENRAQSNQFAYRLALNCLIKNKVVNIR